MQAKLDEALGRDSQAAPVRSRRPSESAGNEEDPRLLRRPGAMGARSLRLVAVAVSATFLAGCTDPPRPPSVTVRPMCTILCVRFTAERNQFTGVITKRQIPLVAERTETGSAHGFTAFRRMERAARQLPGGRGEVGGRVRDQRSLVADGERPSSSAPTCILPFARGLATSTAAGGGSTRRTPPGRGRDRLRAASANAGDESDDPAAAGPTAPQLMEVGTPTGRSSPVPATDHRTTRCARRGCSR